MPQDTFAPAADDFLAALPTFRTQVNSAGVQIEADSVIAADARAVVEDAAADIAAAIAAAPVAVAAKNAAEAAAAQAAAGAAFDDANPVVKGSADATKQVRFEVDGLSTGTTRVLTVPNEDLTLAGRGANTFTGTQTGADNELVQWILRDVAAKYVDKGNSGTSTQTFDFTAGAHQKITATGNFSFIFGGLPPSNATAFMLLEAVNFGAFTVSMTTAINWIMPDGTTTTSLATYLAANTGRPALKSSGTDFFVFWVRDGGFTVYGKLV
jgi:hypothetical protein